MEKPKANRLTSENGIGCGCCAGILLLIVIIFGSFILPIPPRTIQKPAQRICDNLVTAKLIVTRDDCVVSNYAPQYIEGMFPLGVSKEYVEIGMNGFPISQQNSDYVWYRIDRNPRWSMNREFYAFYFHIDILTQTSWHD